MQNKIDLTYLEEMVAGNKELMREMIDIFKEQVPEFKHDMNLYLTENNWPMLGAIAHKAKSSVAIMGLTNLAEELKTLEQLAKNSERTNEYAGMIKIFESACDEGLIQLEEVRKNLL